ncbi:hypothetical protein GGI15_000490 [Coemansia interrupta]|uniref:SEC7 domain-containing protein n=1 Tax=Coemansia interrupta TaxID=1126814 RepID=A0A9W8LMB7_9FUNG|nr:hypothetical protein GGI15_000490 [Coemansia interrupta]
MVSGSQNGPRFVKRSAALNDQSRYDATGYPKSTRSVKRQDGAASSESSSGERLKGFQVRVINTHAGKTVVRAPILEGKKASVEKAAEDAPELPPLSAAELRYNAQRALISTTAVLRTAVGTKTVGRMASKQQLRDRPFRPSTSQTAQSASPAKKSPLTRTLSDRGQEYRPLLFEQVATPANDAFQIDMSFDGGAGANAGANKRTRVVGSVSPEGYHELRLGLSPEMEQGRASVGSMLDQWGITAAAQLAQQKHTEQMELARQQGRHYDDIDGGSDTDSAAEDTVRMVEDLSRGGRPSFDAMFSTGADTKSTSGILSDESQLLIDSIFSGRLSISSPNNRISTSNSRPYNSTDMPPPNGLSRKESTIKSKLKLGTGWSSNSQQQQQQQQQQQTELEQHPIPMEPADAAASASSERDGSKMRKPSFWSIFRGGSQRKESDEKKDSSGLGEAPLQTSGTKQHFLKKQQSSSSGFTENFGFSKLLTLADSKYGTVSSSSSSTTAAAFTNKALPSLPHPSPLLLKQQNLTTASIQTQQQQQQQMPTASGNEDPVAASAVTPSCQDTSAANATDSGAPAPLVSMSSDFSTSSIMDGTLDSARLSNGGFYTPMQEMFPLSAGPAEDACSAQVDADNLAQDTADPQQCEGADTEQKRQLVQGADSHSACTPNDSPVVVSSALKCDSGATPSDNGLEMSPKAERDVLTDGEYDDDDIDSDIVPLSQSRVLVEAQARNSALASGERQTAGVDGNAGLGIVNNDAGVHASDVNNAAAKPHSLSAALATPASAGGGQPKGLSVNVDRPDPTELEGLMPGAKLRFSPDKPTHDIPATADEKASKEQKPEEASGTAEGSEESQDSSIQARAMGKYLYDIEEYNCQFYNQANQKTSERPVEPPRPDVLQGFEVPHLADHAEWLGKREIFNGLALRYYISNYDFSGMRIDECLRMLCSHIFLRGESQVIDRLLVALSQRYVECNPDTRLRSADVAHAVTYSTLLLNTDLHIADIRSSDRMTKSRFVRNTVDTIAQFQISSGGAGAAENGGEDLGATTSSAPTSSMSPPPQLPELDLSKKSMEAAASGTNPADTPMSTSAKLPESAESYDMGGPATAPVSSSEHHSTLRSLVGSMASLNMSGSGSASGHSTTVSRSSRDVVRLMGGRGKRFSFFESSSNSTGGSGNISALGSSIGGGQSGPFGGHISASGTVSAAQTPTMGMATTNAVSSPSSLRAFDRLRRKVSTNGAHTRSRSGTLSMDESPLVLAGRPSLSGSQHSHSQRDGDTLGSMVGRAISAATGGIGDSGRSRETAANAVAAGSMPNLTELSAVLKDVYAGIKSKPLGQPPFARHASLLQEQQQHQNGNANYHAHSGSQYSSSNGLARGSHDQMRPGNSRSSVGFANGGKQSMDADGMGYSRQQHAGYGEHDPHGHSAGGRPSSVRSMPMHPMQRTRSITSMTKAAVSAAAAGSAAIRRPPHHPDLRAATYAPDAVKRSGSSMINFGAAAVSGPGGAMRASPSSASMGAGGSGMGFMPSTAYTAYMRSPMENQHIRSGVLVRKHLFERAGKKASHRAWRTCYVSVDRGTVAMYKMDGRHGGHPDGRELTDTSLQLGSVSLRHTMTHMLPPPGYSRTRPHVFALQLPSGGVYLFQTASEVELRDWVAACNYWAARESKAPYMIGGVYNMEYGWDNTGDFALRFDEREAREIRGETLSPSEQAAEERRIMEEREASRGASILEWTPPNNPMQRSDLDETGQLKALLHHISYLEDELVSHKKVQGSIDERFFPKTQLFHRAFGNWERKAQYILQELIKYQSYADVLQKALKQMQDEMTPAAIPEEPMNTAHDSSIASGSPAMWHPRDMSSAAEDENDDEFDGHVVLHSSKDARDNHHHGGPHHVHNHSHQSLSPHQQHQQQQSHARLSTSGAGGGSGAGVTLSASRASLPQAGSRRTTDSNGNPLSSKSLPIKELLAPASDKARNRASIISPTSASSTTVSTATVTPASAAGIAIDEKRRGSHMSASAVSSPIPDNSTTAAH